MSMAQRSWRTTSALLRQRGLLGCRRILLHYNIPYNIWYSIIIHYIIYTIKYIIVYDNIL